MRTSRMRSQLEGHRVQDSNRDIANKLTYHQLLTLNHDLSRENQHLKNIGNRLGEELRKLHSHFDLHPREENAELYSAINAHPFLQRLQGTLVPLLDTYEHCIQQIQGRFETVNEEFTALEKRYEVVVEENQKLRMQLTDKIAEVVDLYKGGSERLGGGDYGQILMQQINEKQRILVQENDKWEREAQRSKAQCQKQLRQLSDCKRRLQQSTTRAVKAQSKQQQLSKENKYLKEEIFSSQSSLSTLETQNKQIACELERAESQIAFLNKSKEGLLRNMDRLREYCEQKENTPTYYQTDNKSSFDTKRQNSSMGVPSADDENYKKLTKLQKQYDLLLKEKNKLKDQLDQARIPLEDANQKIGELERRLDEAQRQRERFKDSSSSTQLTLQQFKKKYLEDRQTLKKEHQQQIQSIYARNEEALQGKDAIIAKTKQQAENFSLQLLKYKDDSQAYGKLDKGDKATKQKDYEKALAKMQKQLNVNEEKMEINERLCNDKIEIIEREFTHVKDEAEKIKEESQKRNEQLRNTKNELEAAKKGWEESKEQKSLLIEEINRVRGLYETSLKDKERLFDQKLKEIKMVVEESDRRRKVDKQEVEKASREYKRVLEDIRNTYEERIKIMEAELLSYSKNRRDS